MIAVQIARILTNIILFFDTEDEDVLDLDAAVEQMEILGAGLDALDKTFLRELVDAFVVIAPEYGDSQERVRRIPHSFYLEETLAEDDPVRLAELEALRDADD